MRTTAGKPSLKILKSQPLSQIPWLVHGFSTRQGGRSRSYGGKALNLGFTKDDTREAVEHNRRVFLKKIGAHNAAKIWPLITLRQIHSDVIHHVSGMPKDALVGDGLITDTPGIVMGIQTADCLPVILVDTENRAIGVFHAGWRGTLKRILEEGVGEMRRCFGTDPKKIRATIGPCIHDCCYEVGPEVREQFQSQFPYADDLFREIKESDAIREKYPLLFLNARPPGHGESHSKLFLDLVEANRRQLMSVGVLERNINASPLCTSCRSDLLFSYRVEKGSTGRLMGVVAIRPAAKRG